METPLIVIAHLAFGPLMLIISIVFKLYPPKKINNLYGYKTTSSMKSQEVWEEANRYSSSVMIWASILTILAQLIFFVFLDQVQSILFSSGALVLFLIGTIPLTERHIKRNFDETGKPK